VNFHRELMTDRERDEAERDIGVIICRDGPEDAALALRLLTPALEARPDDVPAWEAKGFALGLLRRAEDGLDAFRKALAIEPGRESALTGAAYVAARTGHRQDAIAYWQRAIAISPWRPAYRAELASVYFQNRDWHAAVAACREAIQLNPADLEVRKLLVRSLLGLGDASAARAEFETLLAFDPPDREELLRRFTPLLKTQ
jgi:tetratricopeptide (TPR) repeat protein